MSPLLMKAVTAITLALIFYTIGVWSEHRAKVLRPLHLAFFWLGLCMDTAGTYMMSKIAGASGGGLLSAHGITGVIAIVLMMVHAVWATAVLARRDEKAARAFHRFSVAVWAIWLVPFILGMMMGMGHPAGQSSDIMKDRVAGMYGENHRLAAAKDGGKAGYDEALAVKCSNGTFVGKADGEVVAYKGVPYAKPPTGDLRWKPPVPAKDDDGTYEAYYFGRSPIQTEWPSEPGSYYPQSEDCLYLNVWANSSKDSKEKPVMVFFHGGSYGWGSTADPMYDGQNLVSKYDDIILVTVGYREGLYGFIDLSSVPGGDEYKESGNLGLLDQKCALEWVQKNISAFGGDPDNVTIIGESSGAGSVSLLPLMDGTDGLFRRVIAESGSVALTYSKDECRQLTDMLLDETGCSDMEGLCALSEEDLKAVNEDLNDYNNFPERDGVVLPEDLYGAYESGEADGIDMLIGTNKDEVRYWVWEMAYTAPPLPGAVTYDLMIPIMFENNMKALSADEKKHVDSFLARQGADRVSGLSEFYNETLFRVPAMKQAELHSENGSDVFAYYWTYPCADEKIGACHAVELAYVFGNPDEDIYTGGKFDPDLADAVQDMWVSFARTGDPSTEKYKWDRYDAASRRTMVLGEDIHMESDIKADQRKEIEPLLGRYFNGCYTQLSYNVPQVYRILGMLAAVMMVIVGAVVIPVRLRRKR